MTARPPVETLEASSEGSSESLETGDETAERAGNETRAGGASGSKLSRSEPSMSRTLEAILSKSDADDDLLVPPAGAMGGIGTKTLLGIGVSGLPLPPRAPSLPPKTGDDEQTFSVEDVFDDEGTAVSSVQPNGKGRGAKSGDGGDQVDDLLDEVAEALNVQAATQDSTVGALPGMPVPPARPIRADVSARGGKGDEGDEFEFEDPDDGPTTLNAHGEAGSEDVDIGTDDDDEAVVLGPAKIPSARPVPPLPGRLPPPPAAAAASAGGKRATPFAGLPVATLPSFPAPASGRSRLPTPGPGQALGLPPPGGGRSGPPGGTPVNGVPEVPAHADSGRRSTSGRAAVPGTDRSAGHNATAAVMESISSAVESASVVLKKDVKFRVASLAGVVVATFVVGLLIGRAVIGNGKKTTAVASEVTSATDEVKAAPAVPKAPAEVPAAAPAAPVAPHVAAAPAAPPPAVAEAAPPVAPAIAEAPAAAPVHKRRAHRATLVAKEESLPKASGKSSGPAPKAVSKAAPAAPAGKAAAKKKSTWHDPFAD